MGSAERTLECVLTKVETGALLVKRSCLLIMLEYLKAAGEFVTIDGVMECENGIGDGSVPESGSVCIMYQGKKERKDQIFIKAYSNCTNHT